MKNGIKSIWKQLAAAVLGLLGFASCDKMEDFGGYLVMYGQPHADFKAQGTVKDQDGKPIKGIRVAIERHNYHPNTAGVIYDKNHWYEHDTLYTDDKGVYQLNLSVFEGPDDVKVVFEDIDGKENGGEFSSATVTPKVSHVKKGDNLWYGGSYEVGADAVLKKK